MQSSKLQNYKIFYNNSEEYHHLKREIFTSDLYYFETTSPNPVIIDAGAHIGLATLYFKNLYPTAKITALEPNPPSYALLEKNLFENQIDDVTTFPVGLSDHSGTDTLYFDSTDEQWHSTAGMHKGAWTGTQISDQIEVPVHTLSEIIQRPIDFLKMDIEGSEQRVLTHAQKSLSLITELHIEFHNHPSQSLRTLVELLENTHKVQLFQGTKEVAIKKASGLIQIRAKKR